MTEENIKAENSNTRNPVLASFTYQILPDRGFDSGIIRALEQYPDIEFIDDRERNLFKCAIQRHLMSGVRQLDLKLDSVSELIDHLNTWREISLELSTISNAQDRIAIAALEDSGPLHAAIANTLGLSPELWSLLREEFKKTMLTVLFQIPEYRKYLISILAEGIASAAKQGLQDEVEKWSNDEMLTVTLSL